MVEIDLKATHFKPGKANYERVKRCLGERLNQEVDFIISWTGHGEHFVNSWLMIALFVVCCSPLA